MNVIPPPPAPEARLALELRFVPRSDKEDAVQEAWLAHLEGRSPATAVNTFVRRERRYRARMRTNGERLAS